MPRRNQSLKNSVAVIIWKHQTRVHAVGHPGDDREGILRLYDQTLWADAELKHLYKRMPVFLQEKQSNLATLPTHAKQLYSVQLLSIAHKVSIFGLSAINSYFS